jgi:NAD(P)-dependent dehydrogenase (short-subunit alcohol dehydrogenase family)
MELAGAAVVLTGASRGIGAALAPALAKRGARLVLVARSEDGLERTRAAVTASGGEARVVAGDVADHETATRAVGEAIGAWGKLDLLVNNAGLLTTPRPLVETPLEDWRRVLDVNVIGSVSFLRAALEPMTRAKRGVCVNLSSGWGRSADALVAPYVASKWAIEGLTRAVAEEVTPGIAVVAVNPGVLKTDMLETAFGVADAGHYPEPTALVPHFLRMLEKLGPDSNGRSLDAFDF